MAVKLLERQQTKQLEMVPADLFWRLSVEQYHAMIEKGFLTEDDPVELLGGWLIQKMPKNAPHSTATRLLFNALVALFGAISDGWFVSMQEPITMSSSEPEPDIFVVQGTPRDYSNRHPYPEEVPLLIEVSDATLQRDRTLKKRFYADAGIKEYWVVNLRDSQVEVYSQPIEGVSAEYGQQRTYRGTDQIPVTIDNQPLGHITVSDILPE